MERSNEREHTDSIDLDDDDWDGESVENTYLTFPLDGAVYAVSVANVKEIVRLPEFVEVPDVPDFVRGVINLRGQVIPLLDARKRLGLPEVDYSDRTVAIVLEADGIPTGLVADGVNDVTDIAPENIDDAPSRRTESGQVRAVKGIGRVDGAVSIILDAARLMGGEALEAIRPHAVTQSRS